MKILFRVTIAVILTLTLATCATAQAGNVSTTTGGSNTTTAAQLAAALNAMHEGSARANGDTVTLTRNIQFQRDLTVPEGVTLELTEDGGLWLRNGRTLTVNGTVNAPSKKIGFDDEGGRTTPSITINGNGTMKNLAASREVSSLERKFIKLAGPYPSYSLLTLI